MGASPHTPGHSADSTGGRALGCLGSSFRSPVRPAPDCPLGCPCCCPHPPVRPHTALWPAMARTASAVPSVHTSTSSWSCCLNSRSGVQLPFACVPWTPICFDTPQRRPLLPPACPPLSWDPGASGVVTVYPWSRPGSRGHRAPLFLTPLHPHGPRAVPGRQKLSLGSGQGGSQRPTSRSALAGPDATLARARLPAPPHPGAAPQPQILLERRTGPPPSR